MSGGIPFLGKIRVGLGKVFDENSVSFSRFDGRTISSVIVEGVAAFISMI